ncbi:MAG: hypothetical protein KAQ62_07290, partial [Cyclobacteriaceae bacterium]|nr:hypothetical protein [Cyclobacteriaceae bacterium]
PMERYMFSSVLFVIEEAWLAKRSGVMAVPTRGITDNCFRISLRFIRLDLLTDWISIYEIKTKKQNDKLVYEKSSYGIEGAQ